jgi:RimJ/RimL family protein N-acetyltransferase
MARMTLFSVYPPKDPPTDYPVVQPTDDNGGNSRSEQTTLEHKAKKTASEIPALTIETLARTFYRDSARYGFQQLDYVRFVNLVLDIALKNSVETKAVRKEMRAPGPNGGNDTDLPMTGEKVGIRAFELRDLELFDRWLSDIHGRHFLLSRATSRESEIKELIESPCNIVGIVTLPDQTPIGAITYLNYDSVQRKAELRKLIGDKNWRGKGLAKEATRLWLDYGLSQLRLRKVFLDTLDTNLHNIRLNEELGFQIEGILRNEVYFDGRMHDVLRMGLIRDE